jgi:acyl-CoA thioester hydrolase
MSALYKKKLELRWSDLDPNFHLRHSVYYDFGAQQRIELLANLGITTAVLQREHFGPVIFREECVFKREIRLTDTVYLTAAIARMRPDGSRWTFRHEFVDENDRVLAILNLDGAWLDTHLRKLADPTPTVVQEALQDFPKTADFTWI